jgi:hypothetical protein
MRKTVLLALFTCVFAVRGAFSQPLITSVSPASAEYGQTVTFTGSGFGSAQGSSWALIGGSAADVVSWSDTQVVAKVGLFARNGSSTGIYNGVWGFVSFTVVNPHVTSVSVASGESGDQVTIDGTGFGATQGAGSAWLGNVRVVISSWSDTEIIGTIGSGASNVADGNNESIRAASGATP